MKRSVIPALHPHLCCPFPSFPTERGQWLLQPAGAWTGSRIDVGGGARPLPLRSLLSGALTERWSGGGAPTYGSCGVTARAAEWISARLVILREAGGLPSCWSGCVVAIRMRAGFIWPYGEQSCVRLSGSTASTKSLSGRRPKQEHCLGG